MEIENTRDSDSMRGSRVGFSGSLVSGKKSARFKDDESYVEITLDVRDDSVSVQNIKGADHEAALLASRLEKRPNNTLGSQLSFHLRQVSKELKRMTSSNKFQKIDRSKSGAARALRGLQFMNKNVGTEGWSEVESRFDQLAVNGMLTKSLFGQCIGMKESSEFAEELFDALARKRCITSPAVTKDELREFWEQITDTSFDARLQTFFDM